MADDPKGTWIVVQEFHDAEHEMACVATGPFPSQDKAGDWLDSQPWNKDLVDASVWFLNTPTPIEGESV